MQSWIDYLNISSLDSRQQKIIKFIFLWMQYNDWYSSTYHLSDSEGSQKISENFGARDIYETLKEEILNGGQDVSKGFLRIPVKHDSQIPREGIYKDNGQLLCAYNRDVNCFCKYLKAVYKIRCNFFHGNKYPEEADIDLIIWAYESLNLLLAKLKQQRIIRISL